MTETQKELLSATENCTKISDELQKYKTEHEQSQNYQSEASTHLDQLKTTVNEKVHEIEELRNEADDLKKQLLEATQNTAEIIEK